MKLILVNPSPMALLNLERTKDEDLEWSRIDTPEEAIASLEGQDIDMVLIFLKQIDANVLVKLLPVFSSYPAVKVIGLADTDTSGIIDLLEHIELIPVETGMAE